MTVRSGLPWFHPVANRLIQILARILLDLHIEGLENVPAEGPLIAAFNHTSFLDSVLGAVYLRQDVLPMAKVELFKFPTGLIFSGYGAFPIRRGEGDLSALRSALQILKENHVMLISPEGTRTKSGAMESAREGTALLASRSGAPILPVAVWGGKQFRTNILRLRRTPVGMRIGLPVRVVLPPGKPNRQLLREITDELMFYIARMLPAEYRGVYSDVRSIVPKYVLPVSQADQAGEMEMIA